ncbi:RTX toxin [Salinibacterium sp. TMP30]|uniref:RTX toxin n=1 Tax=Salinibacterium sp. TMP30 TaxID=3138237 RepID=UPI0031392135
MRDTRGIAAIVALALVAGSGLAVVSVSSAAEAHTPSISVSCEGVTVTGLYYEASGSGEGQQNLIKFQLAGGEQQIIPFSKNGSHFFAFPSSTAAYTFTASVTAWNNPTHSSWNRAWTKTSTPCVSQSIIDVTAPRCDVPGGSTDITATFTNLVADRKYEVTLAGGASGTTTSSYTPTQTKGSFTWKETAAGPSYTVTITDTTNRDLTASKTVTSVPCPEVSGIAITATECTVPGEGASIKVNLSNLVVGREYRIDVVNASSNAVVDTHTFVANAATGAYNSAATPSASYFATVVDTSVANAVPLTSATHAFLPCPELLVKPTLTATQCNVLSAEAQGKIVVAVEGLVPGRAYSVIVTDPANTPVLTLNNFVATADRYDAELANLAEGNYTATITDVLLPSNTASATVTLHPCATNETTIELAAEQCTAPGGTSALTATVSSFAVGRDYTVTLMRDNVVVAAAQSLDSSTADAKSFRFDALAPDNTYRVLVTDTKSNPTVIAATDIHLAACPDDPIVMISQTECNVLGASSIAVLASDLVVGQTYTVSVVTKLGDDAVEGVVPITFEADLPTLALTFTGVPNGVAYTVSIVNAAQTLRAESDITLEECDLPTFPLPPEEPPTTDPPIDLPTLPLPPDGPPTTVTSIDLPTLAFTGSSTIAPTLAGLGFLQLGLVLVGFSIARRRSVVRKG